MASNRDRVVRDEAESWRRDGRITPEFYAWVRKEYAGSGDAGTTRTLQTVLMTVAGVLTLIGIFTLVSQFWGDLGRLQKFWTLCGFAALSIVLGAVAHRRPATRPLTQFLLPLAIPLYLFAMSYLQSVPVAPDYASGPNVLTAPKAAAVIAGCALSLLALFFGFHRFPTLALAGPPGLIMAISFLLDYAPFDEAKWRIIQFACLGIVLLLHALFLSIWMGALRLPLAWRPLSARLAMAANVPWGFALITMLVNSYAYARDATNGRPVFDATLVGVPLTALYVAILMAFALRLGLPELTGVCGLFLVGDAIWLGSDKGGLIGAVIAIFATAALLLVLAQRGVLLRIFRPRPPPSAGA
jgi:hypothetical protein